MRVFVITFFLFAVIDGRAQLRAPTPAEKAALNKATFVITDILDRFNSNDWSKDQDFYSGDIAVNPAADVPMNIDNNFERQYHVRMNSDRYTALIKPIEDKINAAMQQKDYKTVQDLGKENKALSWLTVDVYINRKVADVFPADKATCQKISVTGVNACYKSAKDQYSNKAGAYWLLFGNWQAATNGRYGLTYGFKHPHVTPYIENIAVIITGADDRIQQLLKTVNWAEMGNALTP